jgi:soluble lytic murein transglycosylase-like protein
VAAPRVHQVAPTRSVGALLSFAAQHYDLDPALLTKVAWNESHFRADAVSYKGAVGVMQLMDDTARNLGVDRHDPMQNILGGAAYLRRLLNRYHGNTALALAAYNAGPRSVDRFGGLPPFPETQAYVRAVLGNGGAPSKTINSPVFSAR